MTALDEDLEVVAFTIDENQTIREEEPRELWGRLSAGHGSIPRSRVPQDGIYQARTDNGDNAYWRVRVFDTSGGFRHGVFIRLDRAAMEYADERARGKLLQRAFTQAPIELNLRDRNRRYVMVNSGVESYFGIDPDHMIGKRSDEVFASNFGVKYDDDVETVIASGKPVYLIETGVAQDCGLMNLLTVKFPICDDAGSVSHVASLTVDVDRVDANILRLRGILDAVSSGVFVLNRDRSLVAANKKGREILLESGVSEAELVGRLSMDRLEILDIHGSVIPPEERPCTKTIDTGRPTPERIVSLSMPGAERDGPTPWFESTSFPLKDHNGYVHGMVLLLNPCDERLRLQEAKRETDRRFWLLSRNIGEMVALLDSYGRIREASASFEWGAEYRPDGLVGRRLVDLFPAERAAVVGDALERTSRNERVGPFESLLRRANGSLLPVEITVLDATSDDSLHEETDSGENRFVVSMRNISRRRQAEQDRLVFKTVLDHSSQAAAIIDRDTGSLHYANEAFLGLCGAAGDGRAWRDYIADHSAFSVRDLAQSMWEHRSWAGVIPARNVDTGREFPMRCNVDFMPQFLFGGLEEPQRFIFLLCEDHSLELERSRALESAIEAERVANREKARLIRTMTHDLRQPVFAMGLLARSVSQTVSEEKRHLATALGRSVEHLDRMLEGLGLMTALNLKEVRPNIQSVDVGALLGQVSQEAEHSNLDSGIGIRIDSTLATFHSDVVLLERILRNLVVNAIKHSGAKTIAISARDIGKGVEFMVEDDGDGMLDDIRDAVSNELAFGPTHSERIGLGFSIVRQLTELLGGTVSLRTEPGCGTRVDIVIPYQ